MPLTDLAVDAFLALRRTFFDALGNGLPFDLRPKRNTQDDPLDEYICQVLGRELQDARCIRAKGPLISPDLVILREQRCEAVSVQDLAGDTSLVLGVEVKKVERGQNLQVARAAGIDYNTTPPCGRIRVYDVDGYAVDIPGYYLFACQELLPDGRSALSALALCDGDVLNSDFELYVAVTGRREKGIGLGSYGDGMNRNRPMLVFANPLGAPQLDRSVTLVSRRQDLSSADLSLAFEIGRTLVEGTPTDSSEPTGMGSPRIFYAYRPTTDLPRNWQIVRYVDPFPRPRARTTETQQRGRFRLPLRPHREPV